MGNNHNYGIDIIRIIGMMGIIGLHIINAGGILGSSSGINYYITNLFNIIFMSSVNLFAFISGYLYINKTINYNSIINLIITTLFYSFIITFIAFIVNPEFFSNIKVFISCLFPPIINRYWYLVSYVFLFFCIPYINLFIRNIKKVILEKFIFVIFLLFSVISTFGYVDYFRIDYGYSPFWLIYCYIIGSYLKLYGLPSIATKRRMTPAVFISTTVMFLFGIFAKKYGIENFLVRYNSPFVLCNSIFMFCCFCSKKVESGFVKKILRNLSSVSFEVYVIHGHYIILDFVIKGNFSFMSNYRFILLILLIPSIILLIYFICGIFSKIKQKVFNILKVQKLINIFGTILNNNLVK